MRRLTQVEYNNTVMDLFGTNRGTRTSGGTAFEPDKGMPEVVRAVLHREARQIVVPLPPENVAYGFTNIGEVLAVPPFLLVGQDPLPDPSRMRQLARVQACGYIRQGIPAATFPRFTVNIN